MSDLVAIRRAYARRTMEIGRVENARIEAAFAAVPRETFAGPGPWQLYSPDGYKPTPDDDPAHLYQDVLIGLLTDKAINNGQPSGHAMWLAAADPHAGEHVVHIGAGGGYYTAILAELVGAEGRVTAIEFDAGLARRATTNLTRYPNVTVIQGDGVTYPFDAADVVYVNAGVVRPGENWLDRLKPGGRLVVPLTSTQLGTPYPFGAMFRFERTEADYRVRIVSPAGFVSCEGLRDEAADLALAAVFKAGGVQQVVRLARGDAWPDAHVWLRWPGWALLTV